MADDGIVGEVLDVVGDVAQTVGGELKKFGQSATSQISGNSQVSGQPLSADASKIKSVVGSAASDQSTIDGIKGFGESIFGQITGHQAATGQEDIAKMARADNKFSQVESAKVKAKINQVYAEYVAKRAQEEQQKAKMEQRKEEQQEAQGAQLEEKEKQEDMDVATARGKASAEIKNYGAE